MAPNQVLTMLNQEIGALEKISEQQRNEEIETLLSKQRDAEEEFDIGVAEIGRRYEKIKQDRTATLSKIAERLGELFSPEYTPLEEMYNIQHFGIT